MKEDNQLVTIVNDTGLLNPQAELVISKFMPLFEDAKKIIDESKELVVTDASQTAEMRKARESRLRLRDIRVAADKTRKELKEETIKYGNAVQGVYNLIKEAIEPIELHLENQEKYIERIEIEQKQKVEAERGLELSKYVEDIGLYNYKDISDEIFASLLESVKTVFLDKKKREKEAEDARLENEKRHNLWEKRQSQIAPYKFFIDSSKIVLTVETTEEEFQSLLSELKQTKIDFDKEQEERDKENEKLKVDAIAKEKERQKERDAEAAKLLGERIAKEKLEKEKEERIKQEKKDREEREEKERQAKLAPEKDKLLRYAEQIRTIAPPEELSRQGLEIVKKVEEQLLAISQDIKLTIKNL